MNNHGITVAAHAHFGEDISFLGTPIFYIGQEVITKAKNIEEAVHIIKKINRMRIGLCRFLFKRE